MKAFGKYEDALRHFEAYQLTVTDWCAYHDLRKVQLLMLSLTSAAGITMSHAVEKVLLYFKQMNKNDICRCCPGIGRTRKACRVKCCKFCDLHSMVLVGTIRAHSSRVTNETESDGHVIVTLQTRLHVSFKSVPCCKVITASFCHWLWFCIPEVTKAEMKDFFQLFLPMCQM